MNDINIFCLNYNKFEIYTIKTEHNNACTIIKFQKSKITQVRYLQQTNISNDLKGYTHVWRYSNEWWSIAYELKYTIYLVIIYLPMCTHK